MNKLTTQQLQALDLSRHTLVTANAGSGKTFILTQRFFKTIKEEKLKYNQIVAITFTEKAASELLARISKEIDDFLNSTDKSKHISDFEEIRKFREHILSAKISTIHSFCFDLLKEFPVEAEIDPATEIIDELRKKQFIQTSVEETLVENIEDEKVKEILRILGKETTINLIDNLVQKRFFTDQLIKKIYFNNQNNFERYFEYIQSTAKKYFLTIFSDRIKELIELLPLLKKEITSDKNNTSLEESIDAFMINLEKILSDFDLNKFLSVLRLITELFFTKQLEIRKRVFKNVSEESAAFQVQKIIESLKKFISDGVNWEKEKEEEKFLLIQTLIKLYEQSKKKFEDLKAQQRILDFDDLIILAERLLDIEKIRDILNERYRFILIDEFQDTDSIQFSIIKKITKDFKSNNVFVVGDEKQSIYGFRNAQLQVFQNFKTFLKKLYNEENCPTKSVVTLSTSYRSAPSVAAFVNKIFSRLWAHNKIDSNVATYHQLVEYSPLQIGREKYSDEPVVFLVSNDPENQSEMIANYILSLINSGKKIFDRKEERSRKIEFGDFALLFRKRKEIKEYENIFNEKKIPFVVSGGRGFYQSEEIQDWISYLNFLANPHNDLFLLAILRSPFFALSDNQILKISFQEGKSFFEKLKNYTAANPDDYSLKEILNILNSHLKIASRYSIPELLQTILKDTLYYGKIDYASKKSQMIANVEKLIGVAHKYESVGLQDLKSFSAYLKEAFETEDNIESEATISEIKGSVQMMTIHQAKGLEFPIVILPNLHQKFNQSSIKFGDIGINDYFGFVFKLTDGAGNNYHTYSSFFGNMMNEAIDYNEELRLLYVALTRATEKLVISFAHNDEETKQTKEDSFKQIILNSFDEVKLTPLEKNPFKINSQLTFQKVENENIVEETKDYTLKIEVLQNLSSTDSTQSLVNQPTSKSPELNLKIFAEGIESKVREEIFTATQLNVYNFCPAKYLLKFVIGFNPDKNYFSENLDDDFVGGLEFGRVFHKLMERLTKPDLDEISKTIDEILKSQPESLKSNLKSEVLQKCSKLTDNKNFLEIFSAKKSYREFEMKIKFENHILLGIVDRINIDENGITIIDYKTDSFKLEDYDRKVNEYKTQMEFYVLLVSEFFKRNDDINLVLFFINYPDKPFKTKFTSNQIDSIKKHFSQILSNIENGIFQKNLTNCSICEFALRNDQCILKWDGSPLKN